MTLAEKARASELERALRRLDAGHDAREVAEALARRLTNKFLHGPTVMLRQRTGASS
jgi:glutamyl-tRNA reductase